MHRNAKYLGSLEDHRRVAVVPVAIFDVDAHAGIGGEVLAVEGIARKGGLAGLDKPVGVLNDPLGVDAYVVGHHVAGEADAALPRASGEVLIGRGAAQFPGDLIVKERVGRSRRLRSCPSFA
jgi:hypothetical protein